MIHYSINEISTSNYYKLPKILRLHSDPIANSIVSERERDHLALHHNNSLPCFAFSPVKKKSISYQLVSDLCEMEFYGQLCI